MRAAELLGLPDISFIEPNFESLVDKSFDNQLFPANAESSIVLVDEQEYPLAYGIQVSGRWVFTNFLLRQPSPMIFDEFERIGGRVFQEEWDVWMSAVREYFCMMLIRDSPPAMEDYSAGRMEQVTSLIESNWGRGEGTVCLDVGCGSGIGSVALRELGYLPLAFDNDPSQLALGLTTGRLDPSYTMCVDATAASRYMNPSPLAICLMAGTLDPTNEWVWKRIMDQILVVAERAMITVGMEGETEFIVKWCQEKGREVKVFENERDPFYDRWVCLIEPSD